MLIILHHQVPTPSALLFVQRSLLFKFDLSKGVDVRSSTIGRSPIGQASLKTAFRLDEGIIVRQTLSTIVNEFEHRFEIFRNPIAVPTSA